MVTGKNYIGNDLVAEGIIRFKTYNPKLETANKWEFIEVTENELNIAVEKAFNAFKVFRRTSSDERAIFLETIASEIEKVKQIAIDCYMLESGLPLERANSEFSRTLLQLRSFADYLRSGKLTFDKDDTMLTKRYLPLGPVAVFGASNFPFAYSTVGGDTASALAAGCPVIVKSHPMHAGTGEIMAAAIIKAGQVCKMPDGVFSNLNAKNISVGVSLVKHKRIKAVGFTGSLKGGRAIFDLANQRDEPIPVFAEMGSINPIVITQKALKVNTDFWVEKIGDSILQSAGQFCTSPGLIFAIDSEYLMDFSQKLAEKLDNSVSETMLGPSMKKSFISQREKIISQNGASVLTKQVIDNSLLSQPTIAVIEGDKFLKSEIFQEEVFGSFALIVKCLNEDQLLKIIENLNGQLTGTFVSEAEESQNCFEIIEALQNRVGRLVFNGVPTGVQVVKNMHHGGPYPASTDARFTAVGVDAILRWLRPVSYQNIDEKTLTLLNKNTLL